MYYIKGSQAGFGEENVLDIYPAKREVVSEELNYELKS